MEATQRAGLAVWSAVALMLAACAVEPLADAEASIPESLSVVAVEPPMEAPPPVQPEPLVPATPEPEVQQPSPPTEIPSISCSAPATPGGASLCRAPPRSTVTLDGRPAAVADDAGIAIVALSRSQASPARVAARPASSPEQRGTFEVFTSIDF